MASYYAEHPEAEQWRRDTLHRIEHGEENRKLAAIVARDRPSTSRDDARFDIEYDLLPKERHHRAALGTAFELLKQSGAVVEETEGKIKAG
jgi:methylphosphotriester-DNA--protein-cysteine methyltransferase